jgi:hypothetical protein
MVTSDPAKPETVQQSAADAVSNYPKTHYVRFVRHSRVMDYLLCGWTMKPIGGGHGLWAVLMIWPCNCKMVEPK